MEEKKVMNVNEIEEKEAKAEVADEKMEDVQGGVIRPKLRLTTEERKKKFFY